MLPTLLLADDGHDHEHGNEAPATQAASPRFDAHSDLFELVGVVEKDRLRVYLDHFATNEPVTGARIAFESGAAKGVAAPQADGTYLVPLALLPATGHVPFSFTVSAGSDTDLLAGELALGEVHDHPDEASPPVRGLAIGVAAAAALALALFAFAWRKRAARRGGALQ
ncbi:MAG: hypothetical protein EOO24_42790 [Comamonadaceae bacterium]|nr:MAG: hypothetical protein EOO24_42790 [Comamonadaceae bacterium]